MQSSAGTSINGGFVPTGGAASDSDGIGVGGTVLSGVDLACSSVGDTCGADDVVSGGAASDSGGVGMGGTVLPVVEFA